jgi:hypothetical protein
MCNQIVLLKRIVSLSASSDLIFVVNDPTLTKGERRQLVMQRKIFKKEYATLGKNFDMEVADFNPEDEEAPTNDEIFDNISISVSFSSKIIDSKKKSCHRQRNWTETEGEDPVQQTRDQERKVEREKGEEKRQVLE